MVIDRSSMCLSGTTRRCAVVLADGLLIVLGVAEGIGRGRLLLLLVLARRRLLVHLGSRVVGQRLRAVRVRVHGRRGPAIGRGIGARRRVPLRAIVVVALLLLRRRAPLRVESRGTLLLLRWRTSRVWPAWHLLLLLEILGRRDLLAARDGARGP